MTIVAHSREADIAYLSTKFNRIGEEAIRSVLRDCENDRKEAERCLELYEKNGDLRAKGKKRASPRERTDDSNDMKKRKNVDKVRNCSKRSQNQVDEDGPRQEDADVHVSSFLNKECATIDYFTPPEGEVMEDENLEILGEQREEDGDSNELTVPMRTLDNFVFYNAYDNNRYCSIDSINDIDANVVGSGDVAAIFLDEEEGEGDDDDSDSDSGNPPEAIPVQLSAILRWEVHTDEDDGIPELWLLTCFGWYKLLKPAPQYASFFNPILNRIMLVNAVEIALTRNSDIFKLKHSRSSLADADPSSSDHLPVVDEADLKANAAYILEDLDDFIHDNGFQNTDLVKKLKKFAKGKKAKSASKVHFATCKNKTTKPTYRQANPTCVTSHIAAIAKDMFVRKLVEIKEAVEEVERRSKVQEQKSTQSNKAIYKTQTKTAKWIGRPVHEEDGRTYYGKAMVDDETICPGDYVYLRTEDSEPWFAKVIALFSDEEEGSYMFHCRFFSHGRETVLGEFAGERELFLLNDCADNHLESVMGKCNIVHLDVNEREPTEFAHKDWWFYRFWYNNINASFEDASLHEGHVDECFSCSSNEEKEKRNAVEWITGGFRLKGHEYHTNDFVYLLIGEPNEPYVIGQIDSLDKKENTATVRIFMRSDATCSLDHYKMLESGHEQAYKDSHKLHYTNDYEIVKLTDMEGTCWIDRECDISDMITYKGDPNNFYIASTKLMQCTRCKASREEKQKNEAEFLAEFSKLNALDIFGGCGGLSCGMDMSGVVQTRYAIEFNPDAAVSFERNFPEATVYNQCANTLLSRAIAQHGRGEQVEALDDFLGRPLKAMPRPGDIDYIYCGPPCQGFSGMNQYKKMDDIKNTLVCTALSYVDFYKPSYFLLENVRGLVSFKLGKEQIENGVLKYIIRCLTSMGYQTRFSVQQAGNHGVAQSRQRLFVWGAKIGKELPDFPEISHCFPKKGTSIHFKNGTCVNYASRTGGRAPLPRITVGDAISELPGFELKNVHKVFPDNEKYKEIRETTLVKQLDCVNTVAGEDVQDYVNPPVTDFQTWLRNGAKKLHNHVMRGFTDITIERIYNIEMRPGADHLCLPPELEPWCLDPKNPTSERHKFWRGLFGRLDFNEQFKTALTDMSPMGKQGTVIHPNQRRVLTVREAARSQGFPDTFIFDSAAEARNRRVISMHMQVGNAVPVPLALALGLRLKEAMIKDRLKTKQVNKSAKHVRT